MLAQSSGGPTGSSTAFALVASSSNAPASCTANVTADPMRVRTNTTIASATQRRFARGLDLESVIPNSSVGATDAGASSASWVGEQSTGGATTWERGRQHPTPP